MALALTALRGLQHVKKFSRFSRKWAPFGVVTLASNANGPASDKRSEGDGGSYAGGWSWAANVAWQASYLATSAVLDIRTVKCVFSDVKDTDVDVLTEILVCYGAEVVK
ncbi:unnamed protein product [Ostreobium quekettii]|uniref:Uncharacterized protein n=1 Tax=Ostreobium quekettii TaxID=121088 RepID=A0A8S1J0Q6_9CHLO|nr:unnamed protein product [Ostreobium quekettii]